MNEKEAKLVKWGTKLLCIDNQRDGMSTHLTEGKEYTVDFHEVDVFSISDCDKKCGKGNSCQWNIRRFVLPQSPITEEEIRTAKVFDPDLLFRDVSALNFKVNHVSKETVKKNFLSTLNETIGIIKDHPETKTAHELADFLSDYAKDMGSLMYCYEFLTEDEYDIVVERANAILRTVKSKQKTISQR